MVLVKISKIDDILIVSIVSGYLFLWVDSGIPERTLFSKKFVVVIVVFFVGSC
jgi:hypothetical protein